MAITSGLTTSCAKSCAGGVKRIWIANFDDVASVTIDPLDGSITAITMVATKKFYEVQLKRNSKAFTEQFNVSEDGCNNSLTQTLVGNGQCRDQDTRNFLIEVSKQSCCGIIAVHEENNGEVVVWGFLDDLNVRLGGGTQITTGTNLTDASQITLELVCDTIIDGAATEFTLGVAGIVALT
jgi:hypothetical protein